MMKSLAVLLGREPLIWFVAIGAALFCLERYHTPRLESLPSSAQGEARDGSIERRLHVEPELLSSLSRDFVRAMSRTPTNDELEALVENWINEEILHREGTALGLHRDDGVIRRRVADKMMHVLLAQSAIDPPSQAELRAFFEQHAQDYAKETRLDLQHVFFDTAHQDAMSRAQTTLELLRSGASPAGLGDSFSGGRRYRRRTEEQLAMALGDEFVRGLGEVSINSWNLRPSSHGLHLVQVTARTAGDDANFEKDRARIEQDWLSEREADASASAFTALRSKWTIERE